MSAETAVETEVKIRLGDPQDLHSRLIAAGFAITKPRVFEANTIYDDLDRSLRARGCLLRLREVAGRVVVTFKGPADRGKHKSREELETTVGDAGVCADIFSRLGMQPMFRYEKFRTEYERVSEAGVITLDETPVGWFMELEGSPEWIDSTAAQLGFSEQDYLIASYGALYLEYCAETGVEPSHMVFR